MLCALPFLFYICESFLIPPLCAQTSRVKISKILSSTHATTNKKKSSAGICAFSLAQRDDVHMPHDDEMSANIKEIEKLFGTHIKPLNVYDDESYKFSMFFLLLSKALSSIKLIHSLTQPLYLLLARNEIIIKICQKCE